MKGQLNFCTQEIYKINTEIHHNANEVMKSTKFRKKLRDILTNGLF